MHLPQLNPVARADLRLLSGSFMSTGLSRSPAGRSATVVLGFQMGNQALLITGLTTRTLQARPRANCQPPSPVSALLPVPVTTPPPLPCFCNQHHGLVPTPPPPFCTYPPPLEWRVPSSKGEQVRTPGGNHRHTHSTLMAHTLCPSGEGRTGHCFGTKRPLLSHCFPPTALRLHCHFQIRHFSTQLPPHCKVFRQPSFCLSRIGFLWLWLFFSGGFSHIDTTPFKLA